MAGPGVLSMSRAVSLGNTGRKRVNPDTLVLSGGGLKGVATLGALERLRTAGLLAKVKTVVGTSAGALVGALVATRRDFRGALKTIGAHGYAPDFDFDRLSREYGLDNGQCIEKLLLALLDDKDADLTFAQLVAKYDIRLVVCVTNVSQRKAEYLGADTHPDMLIRQAIRMSCSVPLYFGAVKYEQNWYVDGSIVDNFPCDWAADNGATWILGVSTRPVQSSICSFEGFIGAVVESAASSQTCSRADILNLELPGVSSLNFGADPAVIASLFAAGMEQADAFIKKRV